MTLGADKNYETRPFVRELRQMNITPHVAQNNTHRSSVLDGRTTRHVGYAISQRKRKLVEQSFGWMKVIGLLRKVKLRGLEKVSWWFTLAGSSLQPDAAAKTPNLGDGLRENCVPPLASGSAALESAGRPASHSASSRFQRQ